MAIKKSFEKKIIGPYLLIILIMGLFFCFCNTPLTSSDERCHFYRSYQIAHGGFIASSNMAMGVENSWGGCFPQKMYSYIAYFNDHHGKGIGTSKQEAYQLAERIDKDKSEDKVCFQFPSTATFSPLMYIPSAIGIKISELTGAGVNTMLFAGRVGNLVGYLSLLLICYLFAPIGKIPLLLIFSFPTFVNLASSYSADPVTALVTLLFLIFCLRMRMNKEIHFKKLLFLAVVVGLLKLTNVIFLLFSFILPVNSFSSRKKYFSYCISICLIGLLTTVLWNSHFKFIPSQYWQTGGEVGYAIDMILRHPFQVIGIIYNSFIELTPLLVRQMFATSASGAAPFGMYFPMSYCLTGLSIITLYTLCCEKAHFVKGSIHLGLFAWLLALLHILLIMLAFYVGYTKVGSNIVMGVQGRYLILSAYLAMLGLYFITAQAKYVLVERSRALRLLSEFNYGKILLILSYLVLLVCIAFASIARHSKLWF